MRAVAVCLLLLLPCAAAVPAQQRAPASPLRGDDRLHAPLTLAWADRPLGEALPEAGRALGVPLSAEPSVADDQVTLFCRERPAAEILTRLAVHFNFQWRRRGDGYTLLQDLAAARAEEAARRAEVDDALRLAVEYARLLLAASRLTPQQRQERQELLQQAATGARSPLERQALTLEHSALLAAAGPGSTAGAILVLSLTPAHTAPLYADQPVHLSPLPPAVALPARDILFRNNPGQAAGAYELGATLSITRPMGAVSSSRLALASQLAPPATRLMVTLYGKYRTENGSGTRGTSWSAPDVGSLGLAAPAPVEQDEGPAAFPVEPYPRRASRPVPLSELARRLHELAGLDVLADSYVRARLNAGQVAGKHRFGRLLAQLRRSLGYATALEAPPAAAPPPEEQPLRGTLLTLRSESAPWDRRYQVPARHVRPLRDAIVRRGQVSLHELAATVLALRDDQVAGLHSWWAWYLEPGDERSPAVIPDAPDDLSARRGELLLWGLMNQAQRAQAMREEGLALRTLDGRTRAAAVAALTRPEPWRGLPQQERPAIRPEVAHLAILRVDMTPQQVDSWYQYLPDGSLAGSMRRLRAPDSEAGAPPEVRQEDVRLVGETAAAEQWRFQYLLPGTGPEGRDRPLAQVSRTLQLYTAPRPLRPGGG